METKALLIISALCFAVSALTAADPPILQLPQGLLQGVSSRSRNGAEFYSYYAIPYAKTPPARFQPPEPAPMPSWTGTRRQTTPSPICVQMGFFNHYDGRKAVGSEDCLYANVFTSSTGIVTDNNGKLKPVIVYIHGGGFMFGTGADFGPDYLMDEDVVLVTFNYRLSSLGFLNVGHMNANTGDSSSLASGNMGLKDQTLLLKWVHDNIVHFGGDPELVTIYGSSAGSGSVIFHLLSPLSKGLFKHALAASGSALNPWAINPNPNFYATELGKAVGCPVSSGSGALVKCLLAKDAKEIIEKSTSLHPVPLWTLDIPIPLPFGPSIEVQNGSVPAFLPDHPEALFRSGRFAKEVPLLIGFDRNEGLFFVVPMLITPQLTSLLNDNWDKVVPFTQVLHGGAAPAAKFAEAAQDIRKFYFGSSTRVEENEDALELMHSDRYFIHGIRATVQQYARHGADVYPYIWDYWAPDAGFRALVPQKYTGKVLHGEEQPYVFSGPTYGPLNPNNTESTEYSKKFVKVLVSFAKTGKPDASFLGVASGWPRAEKDKPIEWFHFDKVSGVQREDFTARMNFWDQLLKKYGNGAGQSGPGRQEL